MFCCGAQVHEGACASLKRHKLDVERVGKGMECGVLLEGFDVRAPALSFFLTFAVTCGTMFTAV